MADGPPASRRRPRADSSRNRQLLLVAAKSAFETLGASASLEEIARTAGVGIATLYRNFPTRDVLVTEVYSHAMGELFAAADQLSATRPPVNALREWMLLFVDYMATKKLMADALNAMAGGTTALYAGVGQQLENSIGMLTGNAVASGDLTLAIEPLDLLRAIGGVVNASPGENWAESARRMVDILIAGMRRG